MPSPLLSYLTFMRLQLALASFLLTTFASTASLLCAQTPPSKKEMASIIEKAESNAALPSASPFHLSAMLRYQIGNVSADGTYEILWASPDRYREEFRLGHLSATYLALQNKLYVVRNTLVLTYPQWRVRTMIGFPDRRPVQSPVHVRKVFIKQDGGQNVICAQLDSPRKGQTECVTRDAGNLVSIEDEGEVIPSNLTEDEFASFGDRWYPAHMLSTIEGERLEIHLDKLETVSRFADGVFVPPTGATAHDSCAQPAVSNQSGPSLLQWLAMHLGPDATGLQGYYVEVAANGRISRFAKIYQDGSSQEIPAKILRDVRFPVHSCAGTPISYETNTTMYLVPRSTHSQFSQRKNSD